MIIIHACIKVKSEQRKEFLELAKQVTAPSQAEEGNISYYCYRNSPYIHVGLPRGCKGFVQG